MPKKRKIKILTDVVLIDVIDFSKLDVDQQYEIITFITRSYQRMIEKMLLNSNMPLKKLFVHGFVSTGDGFYCILNPRLKGYGVILGLSFNHLSDIIARKYPYFKGVRIAVHTGYVYEFEDILGNKNYIGDGLNDCARYIEQKDFSISTVTVSDAAYESFERFLSLYKDFQFLLEDMEFRRSNLNTFRDKHGKDKSSYIVWLRKDGIINPPNINFNSILEPKGSI